MPQRLGGEDQRVEIELPQVFSGMFLQRHLAAAVGKGQTAVIRPGTVGRQVTTAMGGAELQARKAIQRPLKNEMGERNGGFEWIADDVGQQAVSLQPFLHAWDAL